MEHMDKRKVVLVVIAIVATIAFGIVLGVDISNRNKIKKLESIEDTRLFSYEAEIDSVRNIAEIYEIYDQESYDRAQRDIKMTEEMKELLFPTEEYIGDGIETKVNIVDIQYVYAPESEVQTYVVWLNQTDINGLTREYDVVCKYNQGYLISLYGY